MALPCPKLSSNITAYVNTMLTSLNLFTCEVPPEFLWHTGAVQGDHHPPWLCKAYTRCSTTATIRSLPLMLITPSSNLSSIATNVMLAEKVAMLAGHGDDQLSPFMNVIITDIS